MDKSALFHLSYGVYLCTTWDEGRPTGCVANSAMQITATPPTIAVSVNRNNYTNRCIKDCGHFAISVIGEESDPTLIGKFGFYSGEKINKFDGISYETRGKLPVPNGVLCFLSCRVIDTWETATHTVFLGEIFDAGNLKDGEPMTYSYYHKVLKGKTNVNAPTFQQESFETSDSPKFVCEVCGYEYDGEIPFDELPDDWTCPVCSVGKENFRKK